MVFLCYSAHRSHRSVGWDVCTDRVNPTVDDVETCTDRTDRMIRTRSEYDVILPGMHMIHNMIAPRIIDQYVGGKMIRSFSSRRSTPVETCT